MAVVGSLIPGETGCFACLRRQEDQREYRSEEGRSPPNGRTP
ncbi:hypothetical protein ACFQ0B_23985 [Nonomuraea thailandensis]